MALSTGYHFPKMDVMSVRTKPDKRPAYGKVIAARRAFLGKSAMDIENAYGRALYQKLIYRIEGGDKNPVDLDLQSFAALLNALEWSQQEFIEATGLQLPGITAETTLQMPTPGLETVSLAPDPLDRFTPEPAEWVHFRVMTSASAGTGEPEFIDDDETVSIPRSRLRARGAQKSDVMVVKVNGDCLVSQAIRFSNKNISHGDFAFIHLGAHPSATDIVCLWDDSDGQLILKFVSEQQDPNRPDEVILLDAKGERYIRNVIDLVYRGVVFHRSGDL